MMSETHPSTNAAAETQPNAKPNLRWVAARPTDCMLQLNTPHVQAYASEEPGIRLYMHMAKPHS